MTCRGGILVFAVSLAGAAIVSAATGKPSTVPGANGAIAFQGAYGVYTIASPGAQPRLVVRGVGDPTWSPDGRSLAVVRYLPGPCAPCYWEIERVDVKTGTLTKIVEGSSYEPSPTWSPDGASIAYHSFTPAGDEQIFSSRIDGTGTRQLTSDSNWAIEPSWSPDGSRIAFVRGDGLGAYHVFVMNADGSDVRQLTRTDVPHTGLLLNLRPTWSPDGARIAFASDRTGSFELWTMRSDGSDQTQLSHIGSATGCTTGEGACSLLFHLYPSWSPDGTKIVFAGDPPSQTLFVANADGSGVTDIGPGPEWRPSEPEWQPTISLAVRVATSTPTVKPKQRVRWTASVTNTGPRTATAVAMTLKLGGRATSVVVSRGCQSRPTRCSIASLAPGRSASFAISARAATSGRLTLTASVSAAQADNSPTDDTATSVARVTRAR